MYIDWLKILQNMVPKHIESTLPKQIISLGAFCAFGQHGDDQ